MAGTQGALYFTQPTWRYSSQSEPNSTGITWKSPLEHSNNYLCRLQRPLIWYSKIPVNCLLCFCVATFGWHRFHTFEVFWLLDSLVSEIVSNITIVRREHSFLIWSDGNGFFHLFALELTLFQHKKAKTNCCSVKITKSY